MTTDESVDFYFSAKLPDVRVGLETPGSGSQVLLFADCHNQCSDADNNT